MKKVRIGFVDFWADFKPEESLFYRILSSRYDVELCKDPDFLFCSAFGEKHLKYDCIKIFYTGENQVPDFNLFDYALGFEKMEIGDRYLRFPNYLLCEKEYERMKSKHTRAAEVLAGKDAFCSFVYSNRLASPRRSEFLDKLDSYRTVSSGGRYRNNVGGPVRDKEAFLSRHKFDMAFENCSHPGYTTEKIVQAFAACTVPIYWGDPCIAETFNPEAFINCHDFPSFDAAVERIREIDKDDALYESMLAAPALLAPDPPIEEFLFHIFDQDPPAAFRRSLDFWGRRYLKTARFRDRAFRMSPRGIWRTLKKHTRKKDFLSKKIT